MAFAASFAASVTRTKCRELHRNHYCIIDSFLEETLANSLLQEMLWLSSSSTSGGFSKMSPNRTSFGQTLYDKPGIFEVDLHDDAVRAEKEMHWMSCLFDESKGALIEALKSHLDELLDGDGEEETDKETVLLCEPGDSRARTVKLQYNNGKGGCFPCHYDNPGPPSKRALTCILYLNPCWEEGHGGELTLFPFLQARPVKIPPLFNRLVIFKSNTLLHRVERCLAPPPGRLCLTIWVDGENTNTPQKTQLKLPSSILDSSSGALDEAIRQLVDSPLQRSVSRYVYQEEYEASLRECMHGIGEEVKAGLQEMLAQHAGHLKAVESNPTLLQFVRELRERRARAIAAEGNEAAEMAASAFLFSVD